MWSLILLCAGLPAFADEHPIPLQEQERGIDALDGITTGVSLVAVAQRADSKAVATGTPSSAANFRGDVSATLPAGTMGDASGHLFAHLRLGEGTGLVLDNTYSCTPNSTAFQAAEGGVGIILAQLWYQLDVPLGASAHEHLEFNVGKIDPFVFFDQNTIADDESAQFLNNVFVHNPLLDSGGDAGVDNYGFTPGMRVSYHNGAGDPAWWRVSLGVFAAGSGADFDRSFSSPFVIGQLEYGNRFSEVLEGTYRLYAWRNGLATGYQNEFETNSEVHTGWGISLDQQVGEATTLFARFGQNTGGRVRFDRALTLGAELSGSGWGRADDTLGFAFGRMYTSEGFRAVSATLDVDADGNPDFGYSATGAEEVAELYYRMSINEMLELSPDIQWIRHPGGDATAPSMKLFALRARLSF
ncbi:MAG: carbohydrate porin [Gallionellaceae bacterium]|nr:carbohydrate porin [Gallionellaceae bacterium]